MVEFRARRVFPHLTGSLSLLFLLPLPCLPLCFQLTDERFRFLSLVPPTFAGAFLLVACDMATFHMVLLLCGGCNMTLLCFALCLAASSPCFPCLSATVVGVVSCPVASSCCINIIRQSS